MKPDNLKSLDKRCLYVPTVMLWGALVSFGLELVVWHLRINGLYDQRDAQIMFQLRIVVFFASISSLLYEYQRFREYLNADKDDEDME